jgi:hypothetical protein
MSRCDQCEVLAINGIATHELGCPNSHQHPITGKPYRTECWECERDMPMDPYQQKDRQFCQYCRRRNL